MKNSSVSFCFESCISFISSYCKKWYDFVTNKCINHFLNDKPIVWIGHAVMWILAAVLCICLVPCVITVAIVAALIELINAIDHLLPPKDEDDAYVSLKPMCDGCRHINDCQCKDCKFLSRCQTKCPECGCEDEFTKRPCGDEETHEELSEKKPACATCPELPYCKCNTCGCLNDCNFDCPFEGCQAKCVEILMEEEEFLNDVTDETPDGSDDIESCEEADEASEETNDTDPYGDDGAPCD